MFELTPFANFHPFYDFRDAGPRFPERQFPAFKTDIRETDEAYLLDMELPGFSKEEIHAEIRDGSLTVRAEHRSETESKDENGRYIRRERFCGSYARSFDLTGIRDGEITASYKDGVLELTLPKAEAKSAEGRQLEIL